jgi:hypothetical protein
MRLIKRPIKKQQRPTDAGVPERALRVPCTLVCVCARGRGRQGRVLTFVEGTLEQVVRVFRAAAHAC